MLNLGLIWVVEKAVASLFSLFMDPATGGG
jgi:hypothetical protein